MVDLNVSAVVEGKNKERMILWEQIFLRSASKGQHRFVCVMRKAMVGCFVLLLVREEHKLKLTNMRSIKVKTGVSGLSGNKGSVALRFNFLDSSFFFMNVHLTSGQKNVQNRLDDMRQTFA